MMTPKNKTECPRFGRKSLNIVAAILRGLMEGLYPSLIATQVSVGRSLIHYYLKRLEGMGYVEKEVGVEGFASRTRGAIVVYRLTRNGSKFLAEIEKGVLYRKLRLHNCYWLYPILEQPKIEIDWRKVELQNWGQLIGCELGHTVRKNPNSIEIITDVIYGDNPFELLFRSRDEADRVAFYLEQRFGMVLGRSRLSRKPHFAFYDPLASK